MNMSQEVQAKIAEYKPEIQRAANKILRKTGQSIGDYGPERLFGKVHGLLPMPVRLVIPKKPFVDFCVANQALLMAADTPDAE